MVEKFWTFEEAMAVHKTAIAADPSLRDSPAAPIWQWDALHRLDALEDDYQAGDGAALMEAIFLCADKELVMPPWVQAAYMNSYREVIHFKVGSWDDAFGRPHRKGLRLVDARRRRRLRPRVYRLVRKYLRLRPHKTIDIQLFEDIGKKLHIGATLAEQLYYEQKSWFDAMSRK